MNKKIIARVLLSEEARLDFINIRDLGGLCEVIIKIAVKFQEQYENSQIYYDLYLFSKDDEFGLQGIVIQHEMIGILPFP